MFSLPFSGIMMGYFGGAGLPFFVTTIPGAKGEAKNKGMAGQAFRIHKFFGQLFEYLIPIHVGAVAVHAMKGHSLFARMLPFSNNAAASSAVGAAGAVTAAGVAVSVKPKLENPFASKK